MPTYQFTIVNRTRVEIPKGDLLAVMDGIRTAVLELALNPEDVSVEVGTPGGPNVNDSATVKQVVHASVVNIFHGEGRATVAEGANLAIGDGATAIRVEPATSKAYSPQPLHTFQHDGVGALRTALLRMETDRTRRPRRPSQDQTRRIRTRRQHACLRRIRRGHQPRDGVPRLRHWRVTRTELASRHLRVR